MALKAQEESFDEDSGRQAGLQIATHMHTRTRLAIARQSRGII